MMSAKSPWATSQASIHTLFLLGNDFRSMCRRCYENIFSHAYLHSNIDFSVLSP